MVFPAAGILWKAQSIVCKAYFKQSDSNMGCTEPSSGTRSFGMKGLSTKCVVVDLGWIVMQTKSQRSTRGTAMLEISMGTYGEWAYIQSCLVLRQLVHINQYCLFLK